MAQNDDDIGGTLEKAAKNLAQKGANIINEKLVPVYDAVRDKQHEIIGGEESLLYARISDAAFKRLDLGPDRFAIASDYAIRSNVAAINTNIDRGKVLANKGKKLAEIAVGDAGLKAGKQSWEDIKSLKILDAIANGVEAISGRHTLAEGISKVGGGATNLAKDGVVGVYEKIVSAKAASGNSHAPLPGDADFIGPVKPNIPEFIGPLKPGQHQKIKGGEKGIKVSGGETVTGQPPAQNTPPKPKKHGEQKTH